jgi:hypothetical protein
MANKRQHERHALWFPVTVDVATGQVWAVCKDASAGGVLISGSRSLQLGERVTVIFRITPDSPEQRIAGRIVRVEPPDDHPRAIWVHRMAIEFFEPDANLASLFERASASSLPPPPSSRDF